MTRVTSWRRRDFLVLGSHAMLALPLLSQRATGDPALRALATHLDARIPEWMAKERVPGLGICVIRDARVAWSRSFGVKDAASKAPVTADTMFEAASMSKPVFAYVVMKLCETGVMDLDTPLTRYLPQPFLEGDARLDLITARHVLAHTGGFQNWRSEKSPLKIHFTPGEKHLYSGEGYNYLQTVVTHLLKQDFDTYMKTRLFAPLGMTSSAYAWQDWLAKRMARPHDSEGNPLDNKKSTPEGVARYGAAGAMLTTPSDYAAFVIAVIDPRPADGFRLQRRSINEMLRPHVKLEGGMYPASWALGWQVFHNQTRDFIYHGGDNDGFHCGAVASVAGRSGFVLMTTGENGTAVLRAVLTDGEMQAFLAKP